MNPYQEVAQSSEPAAARPYELSGQAAVHPTGFVPIADYAIIGDSRSVALISRRGSIDWWCLPAFDGDPVFGRLLDLELGGYFEITPAVPCDVTRHYAGDTSILVTEFRSAAGVVRLTDFMPALLEQQKHRHPVPFRSIVRRLEGLSGCVPMRIALRVRPQYGRHGCVPRRIREDCHAFNWPGEALHVVSAVPFAVIDDGLEALQQVEAGQRLDLAVSSSPEAPADLPVLGQIDALQRFTADYWQEWASGCQFAGPHRADVLRSAITLKLLSYAPSGAIIAAPTTSLPETIGGTRNWDYRYCWLRDAGFTLRALLQIGNEREGHGFAEWLLDATRLTRPELQVAYTLYGESRLPERRLDWLTGYRDSRPVRTGNAAACQFQLDSYGEMADALVLYYRSGGMFDSDAHDMIKGVAKVLAERWREPDFGIWETRAGRQQHIHSKVMAWVGLERCLELADHHPRLHSIRKYASARDEIFRWVLQHGVDPQGGYFTATPGGNLDAALLEIPLVRFLPAQDPRVAATVEAIQQRLAVEELVYRYHGPDGLPAGEGAFVICSFWLVEALAHLGRIEEAHARFERLLSRCNDVGLLAEEIDPVTGEQLGNFPQALSHIGLINAALTLVECSK